MKAMILYHPQSEGARSLEEYAEEYARRSGHSIELVSLESRAGSVTAALYDIVRYPALLVVDTDGKLHKEWQGGELPLMDELSGYLAA